MAKKNKTDLPYRPCVGIMLLNDRNEVWVGRRLDGDVDTQHAWQMPQGGIDKGETPETAALREMEEEIGTNKAEIIAEAENWITYDLPDHLIGKVWKGKYRGQTQKWFALRFTGQDSDINIQTKHPEFSEWRWASPAGLPDAVVPFKKQTYIEVLDAFKALFQST